MKFDAQDLFNCYCKRMLYQGSVRERQTTKKWTDFESDMRMNHHEKSFPKPNIAHKIFSVFIQILKELGTPYSF